MYSISSICAWSAVWQHNWRSLHFLADFVAPCHGRLACWNCLRHHPSTRNYTSISVQCQSSELRPKWPAGSRFLQLFHSYQWASDVRRCWLYPALQRTCCSTFEQSIAIIALHIQLLDQWCSLHLVRVFCRAPPEQKHTSTIKINQAKCM